MNVGLAYYNEVDEYAASWLRNLIDAGHIAPGVVDTRSIEDVHPRDLDGFTQCHFFAGIGVWSYALRRAGWSDDRPVWTGSCPCQPFSAAGKGAGFADERHLWPAWHHLITECRPAVIFGEQVASKDAGPWLDLVQDDLEAMGYAFGALPFPAASVGAPHIRDRLYWVADSKSARDGGRSGGFLSAASSMQRAAPGQGDGDAVRANSAARRLANAAAIELPEYRPGRIPGTQEQSSHGMQHGDGAAGGGEVGGRPGPTNGLWRAADWLRCRDGKWRPVEPGAFPLAHGASARVGRLRAYGNAICAPEAQAFIESCMT